MARKEALIVLAEIRIDSLGVISEASAQFHEGLTVLTGETGAGKTMVVTSLHLLSGARADAGRVRLARREPSSKDDSSPTTSHRPPSVRSSESWNRPAPSATRTGPSSPSGQSAATALTAHLGGRSVRREFSPNSRIHF